MTHGLPKITLVKSRNEARVSINGKKYYLGKIGSEQAHRRYEELVSAHLAGRLGLISHTFGCVRVDQLCEAYLHHCFSYYVKRGRHTSEAVIAQRACHLLSCAGLDSMHAADFKPRHLVDYQVWLCRFVNSRGERLTRTTVNKYVAHVVAMYRWAAANELASPEIWTALKAVRPVQRGRPPAPGAKPAIETQRVRAVDKDHLRSTRRHMPAAIRAMVDLQLLTAMRPGEVTSLRLMDLHATRIKGVYIYRVAPEANKTDHHNLDRTVPIGPRARRIVDLFASGDPDEYVFSPALQTKHPRAGQRYTSYSYRRAIHRACDRAGVPRWSPNQLRHNAASKFAHGTSLLMAKSILGHTSIKTTMQYVDEDLRRSIEHAAKVG